MNEPNPAGGTPAQGQTPALAVWSLVLGILSIVLCCTFVTGVPGVICGHKALNRIKNSNGALGGRGLAIAGLVTGYVGIVWAVFFIPMMLAIAIPNFVRARDIAQTNVCVNNLRMIDSAKHQWAMEYHKSGSDTPTMEDLKPYLPGGDTSRLVCPAGGVYTIGPVSEKPQCSHPNHVLP